jgi:hypothetical protein
MALTPEVSAHVRDWRLAALAGLAALLAAAIAAAGLLQQDQRFHNFADTAAFGIPHFGNVVSNLPYALVGIVGLARMGRLETSLPFTAAYAFWCGGFVLVAAGSAWYHAAPADTTLVWDRAAMTIVFAAATALYAADRISPRAGAVALGILAAIGLWSQWHWAVSGDLRAYRFAELLPFVMVPAICLLFPGRVTTLRHAWAIIAIFGLATLCEHYDRVIADAVAVSGHTVKHLVSALAGWLAVAMVSGRATRATMTGRQVRFVRSDGAHLRDGGIRMDENRRDRIAERAHRIWESEGRPDDKAEEHWRRAEAEVAAEEHAAAPDGRSPEPPAPDIDTRPAPPLAAAPPLDAGAAEAAPSAEGGAKPKRNTARPRTARKETAQKVTVRKETARKEPPQG